MSDGQQFRVPATERMAANRRWVGFIENYLLSKSVKGYVLTDLCGFVIGVVISAVFGPIFLIISLVAVVALVIGVVVRPIQGVHALRKMEGPVPSGGEYTGWFGTSAVRLGIPQGRTDEVRYADIKDVHEWPGFVVFTARASTQKLAYPKGVFPGGDSRWLKERSASEQAQTEKHD